MFSKLLKRIFDSLSVRLPDTLGLFCYALARITCSFKGITPNKYFCISMDGFNYGDNVKSMSDYIMENDESAQVIWAFAGKFKKENNIEHGVIIRSYQYYVELMTSGVIFSNKRLRFILFPHKRNSQKYIQLWHGGTPLKKVEADVEKILPRGYVRSAKRDSKLADFMISGSQYQTDLIKRCFWYNGPIKEIGTPRNDVFFKNNTSLIEKVKSTLNIKQETHLVLYAPTFRSGVDMRSLYCMDYHTLTNELQNKFGGNWVFAYRLHPNLLEEQKLRNELKHFYKDAIDCSMYPDIQDLLVASDVMISDYSSTMFDFMLSQKPCFIFATDIDSYNRGFYLDIKSLPFDIIQSNNNIKEIINQFVPADYKMRINTFMKELGLHEDGHACERLYNLLTKKAI